MARERIISADSHVTIRDADVLGHLATQHHESYRIGKLTALRRFVGDEAEKMVDSDQLGLNDDEDEHKWEAAGRPGAFDPHARLADMDTDQVDAEILYTDSWAGAAFYEMPDGGWLAAFQAFNTAAIEFASVDPDRLLPVYIIPIADVDEAVKEVQRVANEGARGAPPAVPDRPRVPGLLGPRLRPALGRDLRDGHVDQPARCEQRVPRDVARARPHADARRHARAAQHLHGRVDRVLDRDRVCSSGSPSSRS